MKTELIRKIILKGYSNQTCEISFAKQPKAIESTIEVVITDDNYEKTFITVLEKDELLAIRNTLNDYIREVFETTVI